jgi:Ni/Co efflux regulator RcnB
MDANFSCWSLLRTSVLLVSMTFFSITAMADKPEWAGRGDDGDGENAYKHGNKHGHKYREEEDRDRSDDDRHEHHQHHDRDQSNGGSIEISMGEYFGEKQRTETREYYRERVRSGHCPPGLAKKHNGCMPAGHSREWVIGEALPKEVKYVSIDPAIKIKLGMPPAGHQFVQVASDILLIAVGTGLVVDAIQDLGQ